MLTDADVPVAFHLGDSGYTIFSAAWGGPPEFEPFRGIDPLDQILVDDRAIYDSMASMIVHGVFHRHPTLREDPLRFGLASRRRPRGTDDLHEGAGRVLGGRCSQDHARQRDHVPRAAHDLRRRLGSGGQQSVIMSSIVEPEVRP
jgi:hypothetical protein